MRWGGVSRYDREEIDGVGDNGGQVIVEYGGGGEKLVME